MEHKVPKELNGATVLDAHQWVLSKLDGESEYSLMDETGKSITLSDLSRGTSTVSITPNGARHNPSASYAFKASVQPQKRGKQFNSRVVAPDGISPSILQAIEASHGTHAAVHMLSKMLSQRSYTHRLSPRGQRTLEAFVIADPVPAVRRNPIGLRETSQGLRMARVLGEPTRVLDDTLLKEVEGYLNEASTGISHISANNQQFTLFLSHVLRPYLIAVQANQQLLKYLNEKLIPHMNRLIDNGRFKPTALEAQGLSKIKAKLTASTKDKLKKAIQKRYDVIVHRLATSPEDFYYGRNEALIAHPGFLLPQVPYMLLPPPLELTGGTRAELFLFQAGEPPMYGMSSKDSYSKGVATIVQQLPPNMLKAAKKLQGEEVQWPIARVNNRPVDFGSIISAETVQQALQSGDIIGILTQAGRAFDQTIDNIGARAPLAADEQGKPNKSLADLNKVVNELVQYGTRSGALHEVLLGLEGGGEKEAEAFQYQFEKLPLAAAIELNISGIRPAPIRWPEGLIFAMMKILSENPDHITNIHTRDKDSPSGTFFQPVLTGLNLKVKLNGTIPKEIKDKLSAAAYNDARTYIKSGITINDLIRKSDADHARWLGASIALHVSKIEGKEHGAFKDKQPLTEKDTISASHDPTKEAEEGDVRLTKFVHMAQKQGLSNFDNQTGEHRPKAMSLLNILQQSITRAKEGGFTPSPDEVKFTLHLLMFCISNISDGTVTAFDPESKSIRGLIETSLFELARDQREETNQMAENINNALTAMSVDTTEGALQQLIINTLIGEQVDSLLAGEAPLIPTPTVFSNPGSFGKGFQTTEGLGEAIASRSPMAKLRSAMDDSLDKNQLKQIKKQIDATKTRLMYTALPQVKNPDDLVSQMADALRATFNEAVKQTEDDLAEAAYLAKGNRRIERLLDRSEKSQVRAEQARSYESLIVSINNTAGSLLNDEDEYVRAFATMMPEDPFQEIPSDVGRHEMFSHPLYRLIQFRDRHNLFMNGIERAEDGARSALMGIRAFITNSEELDAHQSRLEYLIQLIEFTNALQEAYGDVRGYLDGAIEDMQGDKGDFVSPWLYIAALDIRGNFEMRGAIRRKLRDTSATAVMSMDPLQNQGAYDALEVKLVSVVTAIFGGLPSTPPISRIVTNMAGQNVDLSAVKAFLDKMIAANIGFETDTASADKRAQFGLEVTFPEEATRRLGRAQLQAQRDEAADTARAIQEGERAIEMAEYDKTAPGGYDEVDLRGFDHGVYRAMRRLEKDDTKRAKMKKDIFGRLEQSSMAQLDLKRSQEEALIAAAEEKTFAGELALHRLKQGDSSIKEDTTRLVLGQETGPLLYPSSGELSQSEKDDEKVRFHYLVNNIALNTMMSTGEISEKMYNRARRETLPVDSVKAMMAGLEKSKQTRIKDAANRAYLSAVKEAVKEHKPSFDTPANIANDIATQLGMAKAMHERQQANILTRLNPGVVWYD
jgi:hypothetical protein